MVFQRGNNLGGKSKKPWADAIERAIKRMQSEDPQALEKVARKLLSKAARGDIMALKELGDRLDGKSMQPIQITETSPWDGLTVNDIIALANAVNARINLAPSQVGATIDHEEVGALQALPEAAVIPQDGEDAS